MVQNGERGRLTFMPDFDLRRRPGRDVAETILLRARWLQPEDRRLVEAMYDQGMTAQALAQLRGEPARAVRVRVRRHVERMLSDRFVTVLRLRDGWPAARRRVATACVLQGRPMRDAAKHLKISLHTVRRHMEAINTLCEEDER